MSRRVTDLKGTSKDAKDNRASHARNTRASQRASQRAHRSDEAGGGSISLDEEKPRRATPQEVLTKQLKDSMVKEAKQLLESKQAKEFVRGAVDQAIGIGGEFLKDSLKQIVEKSSSGRLLSPSNTNQSGLEVKQERNVTKQPSPFTPAPQHLTTDNPPTGLEDIFKEIVDNFTRRISESAKLRAKAIQDTLNRHKKISNQSDIFDDGVNVDDLGDRPIINTGGDAFSDALRANQNGDAYDDSIGPKPLDFAGINDELKHTVNDSDNPLISKRATRKTNRGLRAKHVGLSITAGNKDRRGREFQTYMRENQKGKTLDRFLNQMSVGDLQAIRKGKDTFVQPGRVHKGNQVNLIKESRRTHIKDINELNPS